MPQTATIPTKDIASHPLFDRDHQTMARVMSRSAKQAGRSFTMLDFAEICLRATGRDYTEAEDGSPAEAVADIAHRRAAVLYVYEALKATPLAIIAEWDGFEEMLRSLETLHGDLP